MIRQLNGNDFKMMLIPRLLILVAVILTGYFAYLEWYYLLIVPAGLLLFSLDMTDRYIPFEDDNYKKSIRYQIKLGIKITILFLVIFLSIVFGYLFLQGRL